MEVKQVLNTFSSILIMKSQVGDQIFFNFFWSLLEKFYDKHSSTGTYV